MKFIFNEHRRLEGSHAFLSASKYHWINYDPDKLVNTYIRHLAVAKGTELHEFAAQCIRLGQKLSRSKKTLNSYVNDAIGFKMEAEKVLYYSDNAFGTADAISFRDNFLRIHDLKTGVVPADMRQLLVYTAFFCLEYKIKPGTIKVELRIYQNDEILIYQPTAEEILPIMDKVVQYDKLIESIKEQEGIA